MRILRWSALGVVLAVVVLLSLFLVVGSPPPVPPGPPENAPRVIVGMGDSTMSGEGAGDYDAATNGKDGDWCHRSPHASILRVKLPTAPQAINLACSGAPSGQVELGETKQYNETSQAARLRDLAITHRVVAIVLAIGANDDPSFSHVLDDCVQSYLSPGRAGCAQTIGPLWQNRVDAMVPKVVRAIRDIRTAMAGAGYQNTDYQLVLQSYASPVAPNVLEPLRNLSGCPLRRDDLQWVHSQAVPVLTDGMRLAARQAGVRFLDLSQAGLGHESCSNTDPKKEWFRRLAVQWSDLQSDQRAAHALQESFHPNAAGHEQIGRCEREFLDGVEPAALCRTGADGDLHAAPVAAPGP
jgi:lysophospholipase L1-like esterase